MKINQVSHVFYFLNSTDYILIIPYHFLQIFLLYALSHLYFLHLCFTFHCLCSSEIVNYIFSHLKVFIIHAYYCVYNCKVVITLVDSKNALNSYSNKIIFIYAIKSSIYPCNLEGN